MDNTIGVTIGTIEHTLSITNDRDQKCQIKVMFDFSTSTDIDIKSWLCANRVIAFQRPTRSLTVDEIKSLDGQIINASDAGKKVKSKTEQIAEYIVIFKKAGLDDDTALEMATKAVENPADVKAITDET